MFGGGPGHGDPAGMGELEFGGSMVPEGAMESSAALQTRPSQGKHSLEFAAARLDARRGPLQHGGRGEARRAAHSIPQE